MKVAIYIGTFYTAPLLTDNIGGSEVMAIQLGEQLLNLKTHAITKVVIYGALHEQNDGKLTSGGVECRTWSRMLTDTEQFDVLIISRFIYAFYLYKLSRFNRIFYWIHDCIFHPSAVMIDKNTNELVATTYDDLSIPAFNTICDKIENVIMVSYWQLQNLKAISQQTNKPINDFHKMIVIPNAVPDKLFSYNISHKIPNSFILTTDPTRAMPNILQMWPTIRQHFPDATLDIYFYGNVTEKDIEFFNQYKKDGITWKGKASPEDIYQHVSRAQYYLYPLIGHETFGLSTVQASALGCHVIATDFSGVGETGKLIGSCVVPQNTSIQEYTQRVINYMRKVNNGGGDDIINTCRNNAKIYYSWENVIDKWVNLLLPHQSR